MSSASSSPCCRSSPSPRPPRAPRTAPRPSSRTLASATRWPASTPGSAASGPRTVAQPIPTARQTVAQTSSRRRVLRATGAHARPAYPLSHRLLPIDRVEPGQSPRVGAPPFWGSDLPLLLGAAMCEIRLTRRATSRAPASSRRPRASDERKEFDRASSRLTFPRHGAASRAPYPRRILAGPPR